MRVRKNNFQPISVISVRGKNPDRLAYVRQKAAKLQTLVEQTLRELSESIWLTLSLDKINFHHLKSVVIPVVLTGASYGVGEYLTNNLSLLFTDTEDNDFIFKFMIATAVLAHSARYRITERQITSHEKFYVAAAGELLAISYLYSSTYQASEAILSQQLSERQSFLASLVNSVLLIPGGIAYLVHKYQQDTIRKQYKKGAQRSDTALISSGLTAVANTFFQVNKLLISELTSVARMFQLGLISNNILNDAGVVRQLRNVPSVLIDLVPQIMLRVISQWSKIGDDYKKNTTTHSVLSMRDSLPHFVSKMRHELREGDLVFCDESNFDPVSVPLNGELVALKKEQGVFTSQISARKFSVNIMPYTGENVWLNQQTAAQLPTEYKEIDQRAIQDSQQPAILEGAQIDFFNKRDHFFVQVRRKKELMLDSGYTKRAIINEIIGEHKTRYINYAITGALFMGLCFENDAYSVSTSSIRSLFTLFQMMIPFSESFLREMVNSRLMRELNQRLSDRPMDTIDALRVVDFCNALAGYYSDKFPSGVAIVSDKTGTLTTSQMHVLGIWNNEMKPDVQAEMLHHAVMPSENDLNQCFATFAAAFTNSKAEIEPEEHAILQKFKEQSLTDDCLSVETIRNNHYIKSFRTSSLRKLESRHLGLYRSLGGRLTIVEEAGQYQLVFFGIPKQDKFNDTALLRDYSIMKTRTRVLSRDWCLARATISPEFFKRLLNAFSQDDKEAIEQAVLSDASLLARFQHLCTFLVDNPVKPGVENFIENSRKAGVPVFVATGDTAKAAENIARLLCADRAEDIYTIRGFQPSVDLSFLFLGRSTVIFAGIDESTLRNFDMLMALKPDCRPNIIFAEMSTEGKAILARHLKMKKYYVAINGDGTNDAGMMREGHIVFGQVNSEGGYVPGIKQYVNLNDRQLQRLHQSQDSFYQLFDIHKLQHSEFVQPFARLSNAQEMVSYALGFKAIKMSFELANAFGFSDVNEIANQHIYSIAFDLVWLWLSFKMIYKHADMPVDSAHLGVSKLPGNIMLATIGSALVESMVCYLALGKSTDLSLMIGMLCLLPTLLTSLFTGYQSVANGLFNEKKIKVEQDEIKQSGISLRATQ